MTFDIDANGILNVTAKDKATSKTQSVRIEASTALSKEEVEKLKNEAAAHAEEDRKKKDLAETRNIAENLIYTAEKALKDAGEKVPPESRTAIEQKINHLKSVKDGSDANAIKSATADLSAEIQKIGQQMYGGKGQNPQGENPQGEGEQGPQA